MKEITIIKTSKLELTKEFVNRLNECLQERRSCDSDKYQVNENDIIAVITGNSKEISRLSGLTAYTEDCIYKCESISIYKVIKSFIDLNLKDSPKKIRIKEKRSKEYENNNN